MKKTLLFFIFTWFIFIQFDNINILGRFTHVFFLSLLILFFRYKYIQISKNELYIYLYMVLITFIGGLYISIYPNNNLLSISLIDIIKSIYYISSFWIIYLTIKQIAIVLTLKQLFNFLLLSHIITLISGFVLFYGNVIHIPVLNYSPVINDNRLALFSKEPSQAAYRVIVLFYISFIYAYFNKKKLFYIYSSLALFLLFLIKSKSSIFILPISLLISYFISLKMKKNDFIKFIPMGIFIVICIALLLMSDYFHYAYTMLFVKQDGSVFTRFIGFETSIRMFLHNPFGYGDLFPSFVQHYLNNTLKNYNLINNELINLLSLTQFNTLLSFKNAFSTILVSYGILGIISIIYIYFYPIKNILNSKSLELTERIILASFFILSFIDLFAQDMIISYIIYFTISYTIINKMLYLRRKKK